MIVPIERVPALIVVDPVWAFEPDNTKVPSPALTNLPEVLAEAPEIVSVWPAVETSMVLVVEPVKVKLRSVLAVLPVYCNVPPPKTKLAAAFDDAPRLPEAPPLPMDETESVPALIVTTPVSVLVPDRIHLPAPALVKAVFPVPASVSVALS